MTHLACLRSWNRPADGQTPRNQVTGSRPWRVVGGRCRRRRQNESNDKMTTTRRLAEALFLASPKQTSLLPAALCPILLFPNQLSRRCLLSFQWNQQMLLFKGSRSYHQKIRAGRFLDARGALLSRTPGGDCSCETRYDDDVGSTRYPLSSSTAVDRRPFPSPRSATLLCWLVSEDAAVPSYAISAPSFLSCLASALSSKSQQQPPEQWLATFATLTLALFLHLRFLRLLW